MHEEMHMTQMQFMNTGAREIVSIFKKVAQTLQVDWARDAREGPRVLMSLRVDFGPMG